MKKILLLAALVALTGCTKEPDAPTGKTNPARAAIIHDVATAQAGVLLVKFDRAVEQKLDALITRSGIADFDAIMQAVNASRMERLFPVNPKTEQKARAAGLHLWYKLYFDQDADLQQVAEQLAAVAEVKTIEYNVAVQCLDDQNRATPYQGAVTRADAPTLPFNDKALKNQWHYCNTGSEGMTGALKIGAKAGADVNLFPAWKLTAGDPSIIVAVVDQGVKWSHEDLSANMWVNPGEKEGASGRDNDGNGYKNDLYGFNFVDGTSEITWDKEKDTGHGTHVAGTVAAVNNNGIGVCGVAGGSGKGDGVKIMSCQIFSNNTGGSTAITAEAIKYAADNGAVILQCSWGYSSGYITSDASFLRQESAEKEALDYFIATAGNETIEGGTVIFSAGNDGRAMAGYPGAYYDYICVSAFAPDFTPAYYTNYYKGVNIAAPGGDVYNEPEKGTGMVLSCSADDEFPYMFMQGTSMACPHVSGIAALGIAYAKQLGKRLTAAELKRMLLSSVRDINPYMTGFKRANVVMDLSRYANNMGGGYIDAYMLLMNIESTPCIYTRAGEMLEYDLSGVFGGGAASLTYTGITVSDDAKATLGITTAPVIEKGILKIRCNNAGSASITVSALVGGKVVGGSVTGATPVEHKIAIFSRQNTAGNGGWL